MFYLKQSTIQAVASRLKQHSITLGVISGLFTCASASTAVAGAKLELDKDRFLNFGAGLRLGYTGTYNASAPKKSRLSHNFAVQNARLYLDGQLHPKFKFTFNTELVWGKWDILDAIAQFEPSPAFNIWLGRMLTPADRIEINGPFYGLSWNQYTVPLFPSDQSTSFDVAGAYGRDEGITIWGSVGKFQYAVGAFDGYHSPTTSGDPLLFAGRFAFNFLNQEKNPAYYTSSTYFGKLGNLLTLAVAGQYQRAGASFSDLNGTPRSENFAGVSVDLFFEGLLRGGHVLNLEGEFKYFNCKCGPDQASTPTFTLFNGMSTFATAGFMVGKPAGPVHFQPYLRHSANFPDPRKASHLSELGLNYLIDGHSLRFNTNATYGDANASGFASSNRVLTFSLGAQYQF